MTPTFSEALRYWLKLGFISFGGPAGQIAIMHQELVVKRSWISEAHFLHALNFCMLLPGPEAQQLATYLGWRMHGAKGGTHHFAGAPDVSWADFAREIMAQAGLACQIIDIPTSAYPTPAARPLNSRLDCSGFEAAFGVKRPDWRQGLSVILKEISV